MFSRGKIDFPRERRGLSEIEVAETLGIQKMIVGVLGMDGQDVVLEARVVDIVPGILDASESTRGGPDDLIELQNQLATELLAALHVSLSGDEQAQLFANRSKETLDGYRRLADTFGAPLDGDQALVTFTRRDVFHDHGSGREVHLEVRLSSVVEQRDGHWLLRGVKRSS